jgi:hypothetical protein
MHFFEKDSKECSILLPSGRPANAASFKDLSFIYSSKKHKNGDAGKM